MGLLDLLKERPIIGQFLRETRKVKRLKREGEIPVTVKKLKLEEK